MSSKFPRRHQNVSPVWSGPALARNVSAAHLVMSPSAVAPSHSSSMNYIILLLYRQTVYSGPGHTHTAFLVFRLKKRNLYLNLYTNSSSVPQPIWLPVSVMIICGMKVGSGYNVRH